METMRVEWIKYVFNFMEMVGDERWWDGTCKRLFRETQQCIQRLSEIRSFWDIKFQLHSRISFVYCISISVCMLCMFVYQTWFLSNILIVFSHFFLFHVFFLLSNLQQTFFSSIFRFQNSVAILVLPIFEFYVTFFFFFLSFVFRLFSLNLVFSLNMIFFHPLIIYADK